MGVGLTKRSCPSPFLPEEQVGGAHALPLGHRQSRIYRGVVVVGRCRFPAGSKGASPLLGTLTTSPDHSVGYTTGGSCAKREAGSLGAGMANFADTDGQIGVGIAWDEHGTCREDQAATKHVERCAGAWLHHRTSAYCVVPTKGTFGHVMALGDTAAVLVVDRIPSPGSPGFWVCHCHCPLCARCTDGSQQPPYICHVIIPVCFLPRSRAEIPPASQ
jgi:hypothetical protein